MSSETQTKSSNNNTAAATRDMLRRRLVELIAQREAKRKARRAGSYRP